MTEKKVEIYGWRKCPFKTNEKDVFSTSVGRVWFSPDKTKAVLEIWSSELYVAVKNINKDKNDYMVCDYVDHYINISFSLK